jgi:hypothetical protein
MSRVELTAPTVTGISVELPDDGDAMIGPESEIHQKPRTCVPDVSRATSGQYCFRARLSAQALPKVDARTMQHQAAARRPGCLHGQQH